MKNELIPPDNLENQLQLRIRNLENARGKMLASLKKAPEGRLHVHKKGKYVQFSHKIAGRSQSAYVSTKNVRLIKALLQKDYYEKALRLTEEQLERLKKFQEWLKVKDLSLVYKNLSVEKQSFTLPVTLSDEEYGRQWLLQRAEFPRKEFFAGTAEFYTGKGLRVRSKSEIIIAEVLEAMKVPFIYEYPLSLEEKSGGRKITLHPDFYCLNARLRKAFVWEHFGMMDKSEYCENFVGKIKLYNQNGYFSGENLICTLENSQSPVSTEEIISIVKKYLI